MFAGSELALRVEVLVEPFGIGRTIERTEDVTDNLLLVLAGESAPE